MTSSKHDKGESPFQDDVERNPGIGQSKGLFATGEKLETIAGDNTIEGDIENDPTPIGSVDERDLGHTNS
jgi:hypothetical protein